MNYPKALRRALAAALLAASVAVSAIAQQFQLPPIIITPPSDQTVTVGQTARFTVVAVGSIQWERQPAEGGEWVDLGNRDGYSGATDSTLVVNNVTSAMGGSRFRCTISTELGEVSTPAVTLIVNSAPTITNQPVNQSVRAGGAVTFSVAVTGAPYPSFQWRKDGVALSGATEESLALANVQTANQGSYSVTVQNSLGTVTSAAAALTVTAAEVAPAIAAQPANQTVVVGGSTTFSVIASGTAPLTYQWRKDGAALAGATNATLNLGNLQASNGGAYTVVVANAAGAVTSNAATLTVTVVPPTITTQPVARTVNVGGGATFTVSATGSAPLAYQWRRDGTALAGATSATLNLTNVQTSEAGSYTVVVSNAAATVTSSGAALTVISGPPTISAHPATQAVAPGSALTLSVTATGGGPLTYQWSRNGAAIAGATNPAYEIRNAQLASAGRYHVAVTNPIGTIASAPAQVNLTGRLWAMGLDSNGQLGVGTVVRRERPQPIASGVRSAAGGLWHSLYLKADGTLWSMGTNSSGQLGDATLNHRSAPVQVATGVVGMAAGHYHSLFVKTDGTLWAMGANSYGELGDGSTQRRSSPVRVTDNVSAVTAGPYHSLFLKTDGSLWAMGQNSYGQLGDGSTTNRSTPVQVASGVSKVAAGYYHSFFVKPDGTLWAMGMNSSGQLGDGTTTQRNSPVQVASGVDTAVARGYFSLIVKSDGTLWATGSNGSGQLGDGTTITRRTPVQVASGVSKAATGLNHSLLLKTDGTLWAMGQNSRGQLGDGTTMQRNLPVPVADNVGSIAAGNLHSLFVKTDGTLHAMGDNSYRQLGDGTDLARSNMVRVADDVGAIGGGYFHALLLMADGRLSTMGENEYGNLGDGTTLARSSPVQVANGVSAVAAGNSHSLFLKADRTLWGVGANFYGQLGDSTTTQRNSPVQIATDVAAVAAGYYHSFFLKTDRTLWAMGLNSFGQLGDGSTIQRNSPVQIATGVGAVAAAYFHSFFLKTDGTLWAMGSNAYGQLGDGTTTQRTSPVQIATGVGAVAAGYYYSLFRKTDGTLWAMGSNAFGQLGDGTTIQRASPVEVASGVEAVAAGGFFSLFLKADGTLWAMGNNGDRQLGDGTTATNRSTPVQVASGVLGVAAGYASTYFVQSVGIGAAPTVTSQPTGGTYASGAAVDLRAAASGSAPIDYRWQRDGVDVPGARSATLSISFMQASDAGSYTVVVSNSAGSATSNAAVLSLSGPPAIGTQPVNRVAVAGGSATLTVAAAGTGPLAYQWRRNGVNLPGATNATLTLASTQAGDAGSYTVVITNAQGSVTSNAVTLAVNPASQLGNLSVRTTAGTGDRSLIVGFVVSGSAANKPILVRGIGPALTAFGVSGALADPQLSLYSGSRELVANDNWGTAANLPQLTQAAQNLGAFPLATGSRDAALLTELPPGSYTAQVVSAGPSGIALIELYDGDTSLASRLINVSARTQVGTGANILIAGLVITGTAPKTVLVRAVGPTLTAFGVSGTLANPQVSVLRGTDSVGSNDDWWTGDGATRLPPVFSSVGAFPLAAQSRDAALVASLAPGAYTVQVSGVGGTTGIALVEVYEAP